MKTQLLVMVAFAAMYSSAFATGDEHGNDCTTCGDEFETTEDIIVCSAVRVPLCVLVDDSSIDFPCLRRPYTSYATHNTQEWLSQWTINPSREQEQLIGNTAKVRIQGDADDRVKFKVVGTDVINGVLRLRHINTVNQFSTGPHNPPTPSGSNSNPDYLDVYLSYSASQLGVADENTLDNTGPHYGGVDGTFLGSGSETLVLSHDDPSSFAGTGAIVLWFGGSTATKPGQQRGQYIGKFKILVQYSN
jgi:hypothetical protein